MSIGRFTRGAKHPQRQGTETDAVVSLCLVKGCGKKAIYKNPYSAASVRAQRGKEVGGYCSEHRHRAVTSGMKQIDNGADYLAERIRRRESSS